MHAPHRLLQQHARIGPFEAGIGVREMRANVAQPGTAEDGVGNGVQQGIGIGMAQQPFSYGICARRQDQRATFDQSMNVPAFANAQVHGVSGTRLQDICASAKSWGKGHLEVWALPATRRGALPTNSIALDSSVTALPAACSVAAIRPGERSLRRLRQPLVGALQRRYTAARLQHQV